MSLIGDCIYESLQKQVRALPTYRLDQDTCDSDVGCGAGICAASLPELNMASLKGDEANVACNARHAQQLPRDTLLVKLSDVLALIHD